MSTFLELGRDVLNQQSFSVLLGCQLNDLSEGKAILELPVKPEFLQQNGFVHGGLLSYLADNALTFAGATVLGPQVLTSEYKINYLKPALGEKLLAEATVVSSSKRQATCECKILAVTPEEEKPVVVALGTIVSTLK